MVIARRKRVVRASYSTPFAIPSPTGGWNARDSLDEMEDTDAIVLDNWFPGFGSCQIRRGSASYATGLGGTVGFLAEFNAGSSRKFIAGANGRIWDISVAGAGVSLAMGFASNNWEWAQFDDSAGGARIGLVNGSDAPQIYNGAVIAAMTISGVGLTPANLNGIHIYKNRSYFWDSRTQEFWYSATNALGGALTKFPLGRVQGTGGNITAIGTWSQDAGDGLADLLVFVLSSGDILVYQSDGDPGATTFSLVGRYATGAPITKRGVKKIGADLLMVTKAGYLSLTDIVAQGRVAENRRSISSKIRSAAITAAQNFGANTGYELFHYPRGNMLLVNIPTGADTSFQHVMNTETLSWCRFTGMNARCFGLYNDLSYFGTPSGTVLQADTGTTDSGAGILADGQTSWNYLSERRRTKRVSGTRAVLRATGNVSYQIGAAMDFQNITMQPSQSIGFGEGAFWDEPFWDDPFWADEYVTSWAWSSMNASGYNISQRLLLQAPNQGVEWLSSTYLLERSAGNI